MTDFEWMFSLSDMVAKLPDDREAIRFHYALRHGTMTMVLYAPRGADTQSPHMQDELYLIVSGSGYFVKSGERRSFAPQDVVFVEAGTEHHFEEVTADFSTWAIFWGPEGGEH